MHTTDVRGSAAEQDAEAGVRPALRGPDPVTSPATPSHPDLIRGVRQTVVTSKKRSPNGRRTYVIDTSVLLADPSAMVRFEEHEVVLRWS